MALDASGEADELRPMVSKQGAGAWRRVKEIQAEVFGARPGEVVWRSFQCPLG